jgi:hypothetical protein
MDEEQIDTFIRDVTALGSRPKSEVMMRLQGIIDRRDSQWHDAVMPLVDLETWEKIKKAMWEIDEPK